MYYYRNSRFPIPTCCVPGPFQTPASPSWMCSRSACQACSPERWSLFFLCSQNHGLAMSVKIIRTDWPKLDLCSQCVFGNVVPVPQKQPHSIPPYSTLGWMHPECSAPQKCTAMQGCWALLGAAAACGASLPAEPGSDPTGGAWRCPCSSGQVEALLACVAWLKAFPGNKTSVLSTRIATCWASCSTFSQGLLQVLGCTQCCLLATTAVIAPSSKTLPSHSCLPQVLVGLFVVSEDKQGQFWTFVWMLKQALSTLACHQMTFSGGCSLPSPTFPPCEIQSGTVTNILLIWTLPHLVFPHPPKVEIVI